MIINCFKLVNDSEKDYYEAKTKPTGRKFVLDILGCLNNTTFNYISNKSYDDLRLLENTILGSLPIAVEASAIFVNDIWKNICNVLWKDSEYKSYRMRALYAHVRNKVFRKYLPVFDFWGDCPYPDRVYQGIDPLPGIFGSIRIDKKEDHP